jgi:hypothetical protein
VAKVKEEDMSHYEVKTNLEAAVYQRFIKVENEALPARMLGRYRGQKRFRNTVLNEKY